MSTTSACSPPDRATSSPAMMAGFFDFRSSATNASMPAGSGRGERPQIVRRQSIDRGLLFHDVDRQRHEHRPLRRIGRHLERAAHDRRDLVGALDLHAPLGHRHRHRDEVMAEQRILQPHSRILLAGRHDHGRTRLQRAVQRADAVAEAGSDVQVRDRDTPRRLRVEAGGADRDTFMQRHDVFELRKCRQAVKQWRFGRARIAEDMTHAVRHERFHQHTTPAHPLPLDCSDPFCASSAGERPVATVRDGQHPRARLRLPHGFKAQPRQRGRGPATSAAEPAKETGHRLGGPFAYFLRLAANSLAASALDS
ncbi:hypothetical protein ACVIIY_000933 [Bradyrhizobium sp. USDA 4515]